MKRIFVSALLASTGLAGTAFAAAPAVPIDPDDIGGVVTSAKGPEAGVWVIAETKDLSTPLVKIVVTDGQGRYVMPDLPKGKYKLWVRGYGLVDSKAVDSEPGKQLNLTAVVAPNAKAAAQVYPANYWFSLLHPPPAGDFPGTGPNGNGIAPGITSAADWVVQVKENCLPCHQLGTKVTRELPTTGNSIEAWDQRIQKMRADDDVTLGHKAREMESQMTNAMTRYGRQRALQIFADWTDRIAKGEIPTEVPPRPAGVERNIVITIWDWAEGKFVHDAVSTDRRNPTFNANGPIYGLDEFWGNMTVLDPVKHTTRLVKVPNSTPPRPGGFEAVVHNPMLDQKGRVWMTEIPSITGAAHPKFCSDGSLSKFAKYFPIESRIGHEMGLWDPKKPDTVELLDYCTNTQILQFQRDGDNTLNLSGDANVMTWINTRVWDETHDGAKAFGWCPMVLDTNGDGKITPDRTQWNEPGKPVDPNKDTRMSSYLYGMGISPPDGAVWYAKFSPFNKTGIVRFTPGKNPPETCLTEYFEPPTRPDGLQSATNVRGVEVDSKGVAWAAFGSGQIGRFDRSKCKVLNGPTATGLHCPEGWTIYDTPGPKIPGQVVGTADWHYLAWVDLYDTLGMGKDMPIINGTTSDSLVTITPEGKHIFLRVPYPQGFYTRSVDGRIDDPKAGWKGRGLWTSYQEVPVWHIEGGEGTGGKVAKFQVRPDPLAH